jgi:hypothetical protein
VDMNNCHCGVPLDGRPPRGRESDLACRELHNELVGRNMKNLGSMVATSNWNS